MIVLPAVLPWHLSTHPVIAPVAERTYTIAADHRVLTVAAESRMIIIPADSRVAAVAS